MRRRSLVVASCVAAAALISSLLVSALDAASIPRIPTNLGLIQRSQKILKELTAPQRFAGEQRLAFLGDSTAISYPPEKRLSPRLAAALERESGGRVRYRVSSFGFPGASAYEYYFFSAVIESGHPDGVVMAFNLTSLSKRWMGLFVRPELAGQIPWARFGEAAQLPLDRIGISLDQLLLQMSVEHLGLGGPWWRLKGEQLRVGRAREDLERWIDGEPPVEAPSLVNWWKLPEPGTPEYRRNEWLARAAMGAALRGAEPDHPMLEMLGATVRVFEKSGVPTLVYAVPANLDNLERLGLLRREGLAKSVLAAREQVEENGGAFVDLHDLFADSMFRDAGTHLHFEEPRDGPRRLAERLAPHVARALDD